MSLLGCTRSLLTRDPPPEQAFVSSKQSWGDKQQLL